MERNGKWLAVAAVFAGSVVLGVAASPAEEAPLTREQILKEGPAAVEKNCIGCHLADKWEGTNRDRDGWVVIVTEMSKLMDEAKMPRMEDKTFNLIVDYFALTRPQ
jgi:mono/diheme cytochrome c family protein